MLYRILGNAPSRDDSSSGERSIESQSSIEITSIGRVEVYESQNLFRLLWRKSRNFSPTQKTQKSFPVNLLRAKKLILRVHREISTPNPKRHINQANHHRNFN